MENISPLIDNIITNLQHGQEIVYQSYSEQRQEDTILYQIETYGVDVYLCTETYFESQYDAGGYSSHPHDPRFYPLRLYELNDHLSSTIRLSSTVLKGGLPFFFNKNIDEISLFDIHTPFDYNTPFRICEFYSYLTSDPFTIHKYNIASDELIEYGYYKEEGKNNSQIFSGLDYSVEHKINSSVLANLLPIFLLNNRYLLYRDLEHITLFALDDNRITWRLDKVDHLAPYSNWILIEKETQKEVCVGMVNYETQSYFSSMQDSSKKYNPIFREFQKLSRLHSK
ncbi:MAG TPA: hypothetical protein PK006_08315 [Saprospiraceae bacterium]|nr:hypothetical protein [Saprospiraceae bacterium]